MKSGTINVVFVTISQETKTFDAGFLYDVITV